MPLSCRVIRISRPGSEYRIFELLRCCSPPPGRLAESLGHSDGPRKAEDASEYGFESNFMMPLCYCKLLPKVSRPEAKLCELRSHWTSIWRRCKLCHRDVKIECRRDPETFFLHVIYHFTCKKKSQSRCGIHFSHLVGTPRRDTNGFKYQ